MISERVNVSELIHHTKDVFSKLESVDRIEILRNGRIAGVLTKPDPDGVALDAMAAAGEIESDWRERQTGGTDLLRNLPKHHLDGPSSSRALEEMRDEERA